MLYSVKMDVQLPPATRSTSAAPGLPRTRTSGAAMTVTRRHP